MGFYTKWRHEVKLKQGLKLWNYFMMQHYINGNYQINIIFRKSRHGPSTHVKDDSQYELKMAITSKQSPSNNFWFHHHSKVGKIPKSF